MSRRGRETRRRLLDAAGDLLQSTPYRTIKVVDIARSAGTSPATFYQYFPDVEAAVLALAEQLSVNGGAELRSLVDGQEWRPDRAGASARRLARGFLDFWEANRSLLTVIDLAALEGDGRFRDLRTSLLNGVSSALEDVVAAGASRSHARAVAGVLTSMLSHVAAHRRGLSDWGVDPDDLEATMAEIIVASLSVT